MAAVLLPAVASASPQGAAPPAPQSVDAQFPAAPTAPAQPPATQVPGVPVAAPAGPTRTFTAPVGLLFNTVRTERVKDFEAFLGHLRFALDKAADPAVQSQARGWRMFKAAEPGPNGTVLYVFALDPAVQGADYSLGRILADAYPDAAQLNEVWKLYTSSVVGGGSLLNLAPLMPVVPPPAAARVPSPGSPSPSAPPTAPQPSAPGAAR